MPVFIELVTDAFEKAFEGRAKEAHLRGRAGTARARRPMRGLEIKDDTYAILKVVRADGTEIQLIDSSDEKGTSNQVTSFILQSVQESRMEKHQIVDTFGEAYIFFFGESPRFIDVQALLINSNDFNWEAEFWANYNHYLRGTKLVEMGARTYLFYDDTIVEGYMLQAQATKTADQPLTVSMSFRMFITHDSNISMVGDGDFPVRASVNLPAAINLTSTSPLEVGIAAGQAARDAGWQEARELQAARGIQQQQAGFGGGKQLTESLRDGLAAGSDLTGILANAARSIDGFYQQAFRTKPLRGKIADNFDEFTAQLPAPPEVAKADQDGPMTMTEKLPDAVSKQAAKRGARVNSPAAYQALGLNATFSGSGGGLRGGYTAQATFAAPRLNPTLGFASAAVSLPTPASFLGGVQVSGGTSGGVGIGGGIEGGLSGQGGFRYSSSGATSSGRFSATGQGQLTGGSGFSGSANLQASYSGSGSGASVDVGGKPSCFALISAPGDLLADGEEQHWEKHYEHHWEYPLPPVTGT